MAINGWLRVRCRPGFGLRIGRHYWHMRRDPIGVYSERHRLGCNWWQVGRWRLTHRWGGGVMEWQPIETAPRDGTRFLVALNNGQVSLLWANSAVERGNRFSWWNCPEGYAVPYEPSHRKTEWDELTVRATHWMPLPAAPVKT